VSTVDERYHRIKDWLTGYGKFVVNEREMDDRVHFSFLIWLDKRGLKPKQKLIPLTIGFPKQLQNGHECRTI
jgi:hypothetical protein